MVAPKGSIYSSTALATKQREVKNAANKQVVYITENGASAYIFCSEEVFERELKQAREQARYDAELELVVHRGMNQLASGAFTTDVDGFCKSVLKDRAIND